MAYFKDTAQAVDLISTMLAAEKWDELSRYYDLKDSDIKIDSLISGDFFIRTERPEVAHPAGFWRYKQPFSPSFKYLSHQSLPDAVIKVIVHIEIDQGGGMIQRGEDFFLLRESAHGYQLLPKEFQADETEK